jgi:DNA sulfur modification protein DndE
MPWIKLNRRGVGGVVAACAIVIVAAYLSLGPAGAQDKLAPGQIQAWKNWTYSLALQAATWGGPLVTMYDLRHNDAVGQKAKARPNSVWRMEDISTPELSKQAGYVTPNVNVIYGFGFLDLRQEPVILQAPDSNGLYYMVEIVDMWTNAFAYVGGKTTGYRGSKFALAGPGWQGQLPDGVKRIDSPTPWVLIQPRVHIYVNGKVDLAGAKKVMDASSLSACRNSWASSRCPPPATTIRLHRSRTPTCRLAHSTSRIHCSSGNC